MSRKENISPNAHIDAAHMSTHRKWQVEMVKWFVAIKQHQKKRQPFRLDLKPLFFILKPQRVEDIFFEPRGKAVVK